MDILVKTGEGLLSQPYQNVAGHQERFMLILDDEIAKPLVSVQDREKLKWLRERLLKNKEIFQRPAFLGSSARNVF